MYFRCFFTFYLFFHHVSFGIKCILLCFFLLFLFLLLYTLSVELFLLWCILRCYFFFCFFFFFLQPISSLLLHSSCYCIVIVLIFSCVRFPLAVRVRVRAFLCKTFCFSLILRFFSLFILPYSSMLFFLFGYFFYLSVYSFPAILSRVITCARIPYLT